MQEVRSADIEIAVGNVVGKLNGIVDLYPFQMELMCALVRKESIFLTSATNSGKTLPCVIFPQVLDELIIMGYEFSPGRVLFVTNLISIQMSMVGSMKDLGVQCQAVTTQNYVEVLDSDIKVLFIREGFKK